jgi:hypothetical protein
MTTPTFHEIYAVVKEQHNPDAEDLKDLTGFSEQAIHFYLQQMVDEDVVISRTSRKGVYWTIS